MTRLAFVACLAMACGDTTSPPSEGASSNTAPAPATQAPVTAAPVTAAPEDEPLDDYAYLPGPAGDATGARFSRFEAGAKVFVGVDDANLRAPDDTVVATLRLGSSVTILAPAGAPVEAIGRRNIWYQVRTESGEEGRLFGGLLTPFGGITALSHDEEDMRGWAVTFSPEGLPRLRIDTAAGSDEATSMDVAVTERFKGGRLEAGTTGWGDFETRFEVMLCRIDGGEAPACSTARIDVDDDKLVQLTPPDPWKYAPDFRTAVTCGKGRALDVSLLNAQPATLLSLKRPDYMRGGGGPAACHEVGTAADGRSLVSCALEEVGKSGPDTANVERFLRDDTRWTFLPCASSKPESDLVELLVEERISLSIDATITDIAGLGAPKSLPVDRGSLTLAWRAPIAVKGKHQPLFEHPAVGAVEGTSTAVVVPQLDGTELVYQWAPTLEWAGPPPSEQAYLAHTDGCAGYPETLINVEPKLKANALETVATLADGTEVKKLKDPAHPLNRKYLKLYDSFQSGAPHTRSPELALGLSEAELLAGSPWLFIQDPWGRYVRLMRKDFQIPAMCEPILYTYANPPTPLRIAPRAPLRFFTTEPPGLHGWTGIAQPDGSILIDGQRWPELFWEGRSVWFRAPARGVVVGNDDLEAYLQLALAAQGLTAHETAGFLNAWLPVLSQHKAVRIAFHSAETIDAIAPLDITPEPDVFLRLLMDATPSAAPPDWDGRPPRFEPPPERDGLVVVEWGGLLRD